MGGAVRRAPKPIGLNEALEAVKAAIETDAPEGRGWVTVDAAARAAGLTLEAARGRLERAVQAGGMEKWTRGRGKTTYYRKAKP